MKRTVKGMDGSGHERSASGGRRGNDGTGPVGMEAQAHSGRTDASGGHRDNKNASGLGSYHYHCGGHPGTPASQWSVSLCRRRGKYSRPRPGPRQTQTQAQTQAQAPAQTQAQAPAQTQAQAQAQTQTQEQEAVWQLPGQEKLPVLRAGIRMGHTGTISVEDGTRVIGCWKQIDGVW